MVTYSRNMIGYGPRLPTNVLCDSESFVPTAGSSVET